MNSSGIRFLLSAAALGVLAGCAQSPGRAAPQSEGVPLFKHTGARQCETPPLSASRLRSEVAALEQAGIRVVSARCGSDNRLYPAVCGGGTGDVWLVSVARGSLAAAGSRGYRALDPALPIQAEECR